MKGSVVLVRSGGNVRRALVVGEDAEAVYVRFWRPREKCWEVFGPISGYRILKIHIVATVSGPKPAEDKEKS